MLGAIAGDVIGSVFEHAPTKSTTFPLSCAGSRFTDDTVLTVATAYAVVSGVPYETAYRDFGRRHPRAGYGRAFRGWLHADAPRPYNSWGNGSAMRVAPIGFAYDTEDQVLREAERSAAVTHDHPEGIKGARAVALGVYLARTGVSKGEIRRRLGQRFGYDLERPLAEIRPTYAFDVSCQGSVPEAVSAFLESSDFEDSIRLAISLGGDADTQASIAGGLAHAHAGTVPEAIATAVRRCLTPDIVEVVDAFGQQFPEAVRVG